MRKFTTEHTVYTFDELSTEAQATALDKLRDINTDYYWYYDEALEEMASEYGITLKWADLCFDLYRNEWTYLDNHDHGRTGDVSYLDNARKFLKQAGFDLRSKDSRELLDNGLGLDCKHYGGGSGRSVMDTAGADISGEAEDKLQACIDELMDKITKYLRDEESYRTSDEAVTETIYANEYEFTEQGELA